MCVYILLSSDSCCLHGVMCDNSTARDRCNASYKLTTMYIFYYIHTLVAKSVLNVLFCIISEEIVLGTINEFCMLFACTDCA